MKTFEQLTIKQVKKQIIVFETSMGRKAESIKVITIGQKTTNGQFRLGDGTMCEHFFAGIEIEGEPIYREYQWNCDKEKIAGCVPVGLTMDDLDDDDDEQLPPNIVERCKYVGQSLATLDLSEADVDVTKELAVPVTHIRMDYPFLVVSGDFNVYKIPEAKTWGELLTETIKVFQREYNADKKAQAMHALEDFVIEPIEIHPNNLATVIIGS